MNQPSNAGGETVWSHVFSHVARLKCWFQRCCATVYQSIRAGKEDDSGDSLHSWSAIAEALIDAQERDRYRIAADLHDSIGQNLSVVKMTIETVRRELGRAPGLERQQRALTSALSRLRITVDELRRIALDLRPSMLEELGLLPTLEWCCREFSEANPELDTVLTVELEEKEIPPSLRSDIYRIVQEALHNVSKHAAADQVEITISRHDDALALTIVDDGCGFEQRDVQGKGIGLYSMQARVDRSGGSLHIQSEENGGTSIEFFWPLAGYGDCDSLAGDNGKNKKGLNERRRRERRCNTD